MANFSVFNFVFNDEELEEEFENFFLTNNLLPLFTNEHRSTPIRVSYNEARSVVTGGAYAKKLLSIADDIHTSTHNKKYEEEMFMILYSAYSLTAMANKSEKIAEHIDYIKSFKSEKRTDNKWNIVFYNDDLA